MQNNRETTEAKEYLLKLSKEANNNSQYLKHRLETINRKYTTALEEGKYSIAHFDIRNDHAASKSKINQEISELQQELEKLERQLSLAERQKQALAVSRQIMQLAKQSEDEKKAREAAELVERLRRERIEFKKKIKMIDVQNKLKEQARMEMIRMTHEEAEKSRLKERKQVLSTRIMSIHQKSQERSEKMESFERQYISHVKDMIQSNKRLYERLEEQNRERLKQEEERMQRILHENVKKETDWSQIRKHQVSYLRLAKQYVIHKDSSLENEFIEMVKQQSSKSNSQLRRLAYRPPQLSNRRVNTETAGLDNPQIRPELTREERKIQGNRLLQESLAKISRSKPKLIRAEQNTGIVTPNYIPEVRNSMRQHLESLAKRLSTQIEVEQAAKTGRDQSYNLRMLSNIRKLDGIIERRNLLEDHAASDPQEDPATSLLLKSIKSKLQLLNPEQ